MLTCDSFAKLLVADSHLLLCVLLVALERKISMRQSREELIKRGVLKEIYDKGKGDRPLRGARKAVCGVCVHVSWNWILFSASPSQDLNL